MLGAFSRSRGAWLCAASLAGASSWACRVSLREASCEAHASGIAGPSPLPSPPPHPLAPPDCRKRPGPAASEQSPGPLPAAATVHKLPLPCFRVRSTFPLQGESQSSDTFTPSPGRARRAGHAGRVPRREPGTRPPRCPQGHRMLDGPRVSELRPHGHQSCGADPPSLQLDPRRGSAGHCRGRRPRHICLPLRSYKSCRERLVQAQGSSRGRSKPGGVTPALRGVCTTTPSSPCPEPGYPAPPDGPASTQGPDDPACSAEDSAESRRRVADPVPRVGMRPGSSPDASVGRGPGDPQP